MTFAEIWVLTEHISSVENGKQNLTISTMQKVAKVLEVSVDQLLNNCYDKRCIR